MINVVVEPKKITSLEGAIDSLAGQLRLTFVDSSPSEFYRLANEVCGATQNEQVSYVRYGSLADGTEIGYMKSQHNGSEADIERLVVNKPDGAVVYLRTGQAVHQREEFVQYYRPFMRMTSRIREFDRTESFGDVSIIKTPINTRGNNYDQIVAGLSEILK